MAGTGEGQTGPMAEIVKPLEGEKHEERAGQTVGGNSTDLKWSEKGVRTESGIMDDGQCVGVWIRNADSGAIGEYERHVSAERREPEKGAEIGKTGESDGVGGNINGGVAKGEGTEQDCRAKQSGKTAENAIDTGNEVTVFPEAHKTRSDGRIWSETHAIRTSQPNEVASQSLLFRVKTHDSTVILTPLAAYRTAFDKLFDTKFELAIERLLLA
jgi:hypothetical protein